MIDFWIDLPLTLRYIILAAFGLIGGGLANYVIYTFAYFNRRAISPWSAAGVDAPPRKRTDRIPVIGWFGLRREAELHGKGFWIRPLLIEIGLAAAVPWLFHYQVIEGGMVNPQLRVPMVLAQLESWATPMFFAHAVLLVLMTAATFIDFDERTIPDIITIPGTLFALVIATCSIFIYPLTMIPVGAMAGAVRDAYPTVYASPNFGDVVDPAWLKDRDLWLGEPRDWTGTGGLATALAIWSVWIFALADRRWSGAIARRRGLARAIQHFCRGLFHYGFWKVLAGLWLIGGIAIAGVFGNGGQAWQGLLTALIGLAVGGAIVWAIRIVASWAMGMEAMGFGDVTLMAMIGAFIGWQGSLAAFFLAPFAAIGIVLVQFIVTRDRATPFGPYLCAGTLWTILGWDAIYNGYLAPNLLMLGPILLWLSLSLLGLLGVILFVWSTIKNRLLR